MLLKRCNSQCELAFDSNSSGSTNRNLKTVQTRFLETAENKISFKAVK